MAYALVSLCQDVQKYVEFNYQIGSTAIVDKHISTNQYSGELSGLQIGYLRVKPENGLSVQLELRSSNPISSMNTNAQAWLTNLHLTFYEFDIKIGSGTLSIGPSTGIKTYVRKQIIASTGASEQGSYSYLAHLPLGLGYSYNFRLSSNFSGQVNGSLPIIGFGLRSPDSDFDEPQVDALHLFNGFWGNLDVKLRYDMNRFQWSAGHFKFIFKKYQLESGAQPFRTFTNDWNWI